MAVLLAGSDPRGTSWAEVARTEVVANTLSPAFTKQLRAIYTFERLQPMRLLLVDADVRGEAASLRLEQQDFLGGWVRAWRREARGHGRLPASQAGRAAAVSSPACTPARLPARSPSRRETHQRCTAPFLPHQGRPPSCCPTCSPRPASGSACSWWTARADRCPAPRRS